MECNKQAQTEDASTIVQSVTAPGRPCTASHAQSALLPPSVRIAPPTLPPKHFAAAMRATPPALPPSETLYNQCVRKAPNSFPLKHSTAEVHATPPALSSLKHFAAGVHTKPPTLSLRNTLPPRCVQRPRLSPSETLPRQRVRSGATPPTSLRPEHCVANVRVRGGGGGWGI